MAICDHEPHLLTDRPGLLIIADKGYVSRELDHYLTERGVRLVRPSYRNRKPHPGEPLLKSIRQLIESVNDTLKGQLNRVGVRIAQRLLALTAAIWHNRATGQPTTRSLTAYDH
uniref:transposase n=1 Tax=Amycolatopsis thermoflava TaxID=84480 RepID=UPI000426CF90|nr:transposase [Amycolatopsis thermoflava]